MVAAALHAGRTWHPAAKYDLRHHNLRKGQRVTLLLAENNEGNLLMKDSTHYAAVATVEPWRVVSFVPVAVVAAPEFVRLCGQWVRPQEISPPHPDSWVCYRTVPAGLRIPRRAFDDEDVRYSTCISVQRCKEPDCYAPSQVGTLCTACFWRLGI